MHKTVGRVGWALLLAMIAVALLAPVLGYDQAASLLREAGGDPGKIRQLALEKQLLEAEELDRLLDYRRAVRNL